MDVHGVSSSGAPGRTGRVAGRERERGSRTFAFARTDGGMILSGPNDCRGSTKDARILPVFLHSPAQYVSVNQPSDVTAAGLRRSLIEVSETSQSPCETVTYSSWTRAADC